MTPDYLFASRRLFALFVNPWKLLFFLAASVAFSAAALAELSHPRTLDTYHAILAWSGLVLFGAGALIFGAQLVYRVIARRPLVEFTTEGARYRVFPVHWRESLMPWSALAGISVSRLASSGARQTYLILTPRPQELDPALSQPSPGEIVAAWRSRHPVRISLHFAFLRVTPDRCERLLAEIQSHCASEIARYDVYVEPEIRSML